MFTDAENKTTVSITSLLTGKAVTLKFARKPATGKPEEESVTAFTIAAGAAKPTVKVAMFHLAESADVLDTGTVTFTGIPDNFQFKLTTDTEWSEPIESATDFSLAVGYTATAYQFRVAATADKQAGLPGSVKVAAPPKAPKLKVNYKKETFKPKAGSLYSADGGATWLKAPGTEIPVSDYYGGTLFIRLPPTNKKPASDAQELILLPRVPFVPTAQDVSIQKDKKGNDVAVMRSGAWQIEYKNGAKWKKGLPKTLVSDTEIRFMTNTRFAPGESVILTTEGLTNN
jgi:hypothetical protein